MGLSAPAPNMKHGMPRRIHHKPWGVVGLWGWGGIVLVGRVLKSQGKRSARQYVCVYVCGCPTLIPLLATPRAQVESVAICGIGNVALDCARALLAPAARFQPTDMAGHALRQLAGGSAVRRVHLVARRGPVQVRGPGTGGARVRVRLCMCV